MSNRNNKSKSPQTKKPIPYDKDLMKYLILQKITKPQPPVELITKTQPDEDSEVEDFKQEIEQKYKQCKANKVYQFPKEQYESSSDASLESLTDVTVYNLNSELHLTDATQPQFIKALNEKLMLLQEDTPPFKSAKQHNYAPVLKSSRKLGDSNRTQQVNRSQTGGINQLKIIFLSFLGSQEKGKPPKKDTPSQSAEKNKQKSKQIQQILKIAQKQREASFYKKPQVNNNYVNISANINNSVIITGKPPQRQDYRVKTEYDEPEINLNQFQVNPKSRLFFYSQIYLNYQQIQIKRNSETQKNGISIGTQDIKLYYGQLTSRVFVYIKKCQKLEQKLQSLNNNFIIFFFIIQNNKFLKQKMKQDNKKKMTMAQGPKNQMKGKPQEIYKLPEDMESEIRDCFNFYDKDKKGVIDKNQFRSILGNFGFINKNVKEIDEEIRGDVSENQQSFYFNDVLTVITKKWFGNKGRDEEIDEIYDLFVRKDKKVGINEIKAVFGQYLDIQISDADILEFIQDADNDGDGLLTKNEIATKMGYY